MIAQIEKSFPPKAWRKSGTIFPITFIDITLNTIKSTPDKTDAIIAPLLPPVAFPNIAAGPASKKQATVKGIIAILVNLKYPIINIVIIEDIIDTINPIKSAFGE